MLMFDPTINWSRELLESPIPDLLVVRSQSPSRIDRPWHTTGEQNSWSSAGVEFTAVDRKERHIDFIFFDTQSASSEERRQVFEYSEKLNDEETAMDWYRCTFSANNHVEVLSKGELTTTQAAPIAANSQRSNYNPVSHECLGPENGRCREFRAFDDFSENAASSHEATFVCRVD